MNFLEYYRNNLAYIRSLGAEFAAEFPKIASRLELSAMECQDPYVERLLEGTAFLAARVEEKLESGFPRLLESVLSAVAPLALYPVPSYTILDLEPDFTDERLKNGITIQPGDEFHCKLNNIQTPCRFSAMGSKKLYPLTLTEASYAHLSTIALTIGVFNNLISSTFLLFAIKLFLVTCISCENQSPLKCINPFLPCKKFD